MIATWYPSSARPGLGVFVREHARALSRVADVVIVYPDAYERADRGGWVVHDRYEDGLRVLRVHVRRPDVRGLGVVLQAAGVRTALRRLRREGWAPDVLHAHVQPAGFLALAARPRGVPVVVTEHYSGFGLGTVEGLALRMARFTFRHADLVCPVSEDLGRHLRQAGVEARLQTVPNTIDVSRFRPPASRDRRGPVRALSVAGLTEVKQMPVLLKALALIRSAGDGPEIVLDVAGDGPLRDQLREMTDAHGLADAVRWLGHRTADEVAELMRTSHMLVLPSRWENLPTVLCEAMASGLPVIATRVGGVPEIVDADSGVIVPPGDPAALARALVKVARDLDRFDPHGLHAKAAARYGFEAVALRWWAIYDELITEARR